MNYGVTRSYAYNPPPAKRRRRIRPRFFLFLAIVLGIPGFFIVRALMPATGETTVTYGEIVFGKSYAGLIIRNERIYTSESYGSIEYGAVEGEEVLMGDTVLSLYSTNVDKLQTELEEVRTEITNYVQHDILKNVIDQDLQMFESNIAGITDEITVITRGAITGDLVNVENRLKAQMEERESYIKNTANARSDATLARLYERQTSLVTQIDAAMTQYKAEADGMVSFYFDGLDLLLSPDTLEQLSVQNVRDMLAGKNKARGGKQMLYRLVETGDWYVALIAPEREWEVAFGQSCQVSFEGYNGLSVNATVSRIEVDSGDTLVVLRVSGEVKRLLDVRNATVNIGGSASGLLVPINTLRKSGETDTVLLSGSDDTVPVRILGQDGKNAVVESVEDGALKEGMRVVYR